VSIATDRLPLLETHTPATVEELTQLVRDAADRQLALYPMGGGSSLELGLPAKRPGFGVSLTGLADTIDYPARDLTITAQAGVSLATLQATLAGEGQRLPIDAPSAEVATLGGLIATNFSGPSRFGHGTMRDHLIGIRAVDGRGVPFAGGGRVVKNVAGYDLCKLLTGSLGTLAIITEVTLKLKPLPPAHLLLACTPRDLAHAERLLAQLITSRVTPFAVELLAGPAWESPPGLFGTGSSPIRLVVGLEGTETEVNWMRRQLQAEWSAAEVGETTELSGADYAAAWQQLVDFPKPLHAPLVLKLTATPSRVTWLVEQIQTASPTVSIQAHAGNGILIARFAEFPSEGLSRLLAGELKPAAARAHGAVTILSNPSGSEMTPHSVWGATDVPFWLMKQVKQAFDPFDILNPGRFVY